MQHHRRVVFAAAAWLLCVACASGRSTTASATPSATSSTRGSPDPERFRLEVDSFAIRDAALPPQREGIVFVGSSIFRLWSTLAEQMAPLPVLNRAFGGSQSPDQLYFFDRTVARYRPRVIVYYCGSNDLNEGTSAHRIAGNVQAFARRAHAELPAARLVFTSVLRAPQKRARWSGVDSVNAAVKAWVASDTLASYVDLNPAVFDANGAPRLELYRPDHLHYETPAYALFSAILRPVVERAWVASQSR